jgi:RHS repeat-associated protein
VEGETLMYYNSLGQARFSQDPRQRARDREQYGYVKFDAQGRTIEGGIAIGSLAEALQNIENPNFPSVDLSEVSYTAYSEATDIHYLNQTEDPNLAQTFLEDRVSYVIRDTDGNPNTTLDQTSSTFSYDVHGNVKWIAQHNPRLGTKYLRYDYDLISGKVLKVCYQEGVEGEQLYHRYKYDADNRLRQVETSRDGIIWDRDAQYEYYMHGPLAYTLLGEDKIQGIDYVYTLQGWLKAMDFLNFEKSSRDVTHETARTAFGMVLGYYAGDYKRGNTPIANWINKAYAPVDAPNNPRENGGGSLFNGNIATWSSRQYISGEANAAMDNSFDNMTAFAYTYDRLNRIRGSYFKTNPSNAIGGYGNDLEDRYGGRYTLDGNGNLLTLLRNAYNLEGNKTLDNLSYNYQRDATGKLVSNRLNGVTDASTQGNAFQASILSGTTNFEYDPIGNIIKESGTNKDNVGYETQIVWNNSGKVDAVTETVGGAVRKVVNYEYDPSGNRIYKALKETTADPNSPNITENFYVRDAQGNIMAVYERKNFGDANTKDILFLKEQNIYGSDMIGMYQPNEVVQNAPKYAEKIEIGFRIAGEISTTSQEGIRFAQGALLMEGTTAKVSASNEALGDHFYGIVLEGVFSREVNKKVYSLKDHLGNIRAVIGDVKTWDATLAEYVVDLKSLHNYYPFGMEMPNGTYQSEKYRFGFNGKENDREWGTGGVTQDYGFRLYNPAMGRFLSVDPLTKSYPWWTPYQFAGNAPIRYIDLDGLEKAEPEMFELAKLQLDYYQQELDNGNIEDKTEVEGLKLSTLLSDLRADLNDVTTATCQRLGYYCGKSSLQSVSASYNPMAYTSHILDLALNGKSKFGGKGRTTKLESDLDELGLDGGENWPGPTTRSSGEIFGKSLNSSTTNKSFVRKLLGDRLGDEGNSIPFEMRRMMRYVGLKPQKGRIYAKFNEEDIKVMSNAISNKLLPIVFDNHGISGSEPDEGVQGRFGIHFIVMHKLSTSSGSVYYDFGHFGRIDTQYRPTSLFTEALKSYWIPIKR